MATKRKRDAEETALADKDDVASPQPQRDCQECENTRGSNVNAACLCGSIILCDVCKKEAKPKQCECCSKLICTDDCLDDRLAMLCGATDGYDHPPGCGAMICESCRQVSEWSSCFCSQTMFCPACSLTGESAMNRCNRCKTLYCPDESGDCGRECEGCMKMLCCVCLRVDDPRRLKYCATCKPMHQDSNRGNGYSGGGYGDSDESEGSY